MFGFMALLLTSQPLGIDQVIRDKRALYNAAISTRDLATIETMLAPAYVALPGSIGRPISQQGLLALFAKSFQDPSFVTYVRTPGRIEASSSLKRVAETGRWTGTWNKPDGTMRVSGVYQAFWIPHRDGWKLINESFVTLECTGSRECSSNG